MGAAILDLACMTEVGAKADSGEKTSCFVDVCNGNLTLWTYLGIKLIEKKVHFANAYGPPHID